MDILLCLCFLKSEGLAIIANVDRTGVRGEVKNNKSITHRCIFKIHICVCNSKIDEDVEEDFAA